jgi:hypothetical protein
MDEERQRGGFYNGQTKKEENERGSLSGITIHRNKFKEDWKGA